MLSLKLNYKKTIYIGFAFFLITAFWQAYDTIIPKILTNRFGLSQSLSGAVMALDNILALFLLPLFGSLSDKCTSKQGRRTPFIIVGTIAAACAFLALSFADNMQLASLEDITSDNMETMHAIYDAELTITTPGGEKINVCREFERDEFAQMALKPDSDVYTEYILPAKSAYAWNLTVASPGTLVFFMGILLVALVSMSIFRSPAVALMPDVTIKPLRSKANAVINLMGAAGGIIVLALGILFKTGKPENSYNSYIFFFLSISVLMIVSLFIFTKKVNEPLFVKEMQEESKKFGLTEEEDEQGGDRALSQGEKRSLIFLLLSVVFWYMGYNAITSKYSVYAGAVLSLDYNLTLMIATGSAIVTYIPVGIIASKIGRKKTILAGIVILAAAFAVAAFMRAGSSALLMNALFTLAGIGWATINVNSFPMVVELATGSNVGKYTGIYYTASMAAQTLTPVLSGMLLDIKLTYLFPYGALFVMLSFVTMCFVQHGDSKPTASVSIEAFDIDD